MKAVILAGGLGTRLSEETYLKPKPMVEVGGRPILWHIMKIYSTYGINDFIICCGYKSYIIKEYFANYCLHLSDVTFDMSDNTMQLHQNNAEHWKVTLVDTGEKTATGGRLKRVSSYIGEEDFCFTYGDGVSDVNIADLVRFHQDHRKLATVTAVQPPGRFGSLELAGDGVKGFTEKPIGDGAWINAGFFVLSHKVLDYIEGDGISWELEPMQQLVAEGNMRAYKHAGYWQAMDTLRDREQLNRLWESGKAPWKQWK